MPTRRATNNRQQLRVLIVDDHPLLCEGLEMHLGRSGDIRVVGSVHSGANAVSAARRTKADVVVLDLHLPGMDGMGVLSGLKGLKSPPKVLVFTSFPYPENLKEALQRGADGFLSKESDPDLIGPAIRAAFSGQIVVAKKNVMSMIGVGPDEPVEPRRHRGRPERGIESTLTRREREVLELATKGLDNEGISKELYISRNTVKKHLQNVYSKIGVSSRIQAVLWANRHLPA